MQEARLDIHARGWEHERSAFFDVRVCHPNAESYSDLKPQKIIECTKITKNANIQVEFSTMNTEASRPLYLLQPMEWAKNVCNTTVA